MKTTPIFIHSMFRTGSTYIWNKFRQNEQFYCYYEPFHQELINITKDNPLWMFDYESTQRFRHPNVSKEYLLEYKNLVKPNEKGVPLFKKSFSFDDFYLADDAKMPDIKKYITTLIKNAGEKTPLLQFNRSSFRMGWFKKNFKQSINVYLFRDPRSQFNSFLDIYGNLELISFLTMNLLTASINKKSAQFRLLATMVPLIEYHADAFDQESYFYSQLLPIYDIKEQYNIFYFIWFRSLMEAANHADFSIHIDRLSSNPIHRADIINHFKSYGIVGVDFEDCRISEYKNLPISEKEMEKIEQRIQALVMDHYPNKQQLLKRLNDIYSKDLQLFQQLPKIKSDTNKTTNIQSLVEERLYKAFQHFTTQLYNQNEALKRSESRLREKKDLPTELSEDLISQQNQLQHKNSRIKSLETWLTQSNLTLDERNQELEKSKTLILEQTNKMEQVQNIKVQLIAKANDLSQDLAEKRKEIQQLEKQVETLQQQRQQLEEEKNQEEKNIKEKNQNLVILEESVKDLEDKIQELNQQLNQQNKYLLELKLKTEQQKETFLRYSQNNEKLNQWANQLKTRLENKEQELARLLASRSYRLGHALLFPIRGFIRIGNKIFRKK